MILCPLDSQNTDPKSHQLLVLEVRFACQKWNRNEKKPRGVNPSFATAEGELLQKRLLCYQQSSLLGPMVCVGFAHRFG